MTQIFLSEHARLLDTSEQVAARKAKMQYFKKCFNVFLPGMYFSVDIEKYLAKGVPKIQYPNKGPLKLFRGFNAYFAE